MKQDLVQKKEEHGLSVTIERYEIMVIVKAAWESSFARKETI